MRKDIFEILYEIWWLRPICKIYLKLKEMIRGKVREKIKENISVNEDSSIEILDAGALPYARFMIKVQNNNFSSLSIDAFNITLSFGRNNSVFENIFWNRDGTTEPPQNIVLPEIEGKDEGFLQIKTMLPYYLYFPNQDMTIFINGTFKLRSDAGPIQHEFTTKARLKREELENRTTAQDRLIECFSPPEPVVDD